MFIHLVRLRAVALLAVVLLVAGAATGCSDDSSGSSDVTSAAVEAELEEARQAVESMRAEAEAELEAAKEAADAIRIEAADEIAAPEMLEALDSWVTSLRDQDVFGMVELYAEDSVWHDEALDETYTGVTGAKIGWGIFGGVDQVDLAEPVAVDGDTAVVRWSLDGVGEWSFTGVSVLTFDAAQIVAETVYYDCAQSPVASRCANMG